MDRPEPGLVKWSPNPSIDSFVHVNLQHRVVQLYEPTGHARNGRFDYDKISRHDDFPPLTTYDWSPTNPGLLAVGTGTGIVNLLKIDDNSNSFAELGLKMTRTCQAVAFNTTGLLAVGLDRVRMDQSLHIWDVSRLSSTDKGLSKEVTEPKNRLEPSVSISSIKFFEDSPQTLVAGIKSQGLRMHDLRDPQNMALFQTKCNNNLAIDYADQNYFASSALDQPGVMVWDRRATSRPVASHTYTQAIAEDDIPWGGALRLDRVIETDSDPFLAEGKHSLIRSLRYCRDQRGLLAVLSRTGQLRVLETNKERPSSSASKAPQAPESPELLEVRKSHEMDPSYVETTRKNNRIVSFDWVNLDSPTLQPRMLVLRANGGFDILERPSYTADHVFKMVPWQAPHRGLEEGLPYLDLMRFEPRQALRMLGPVLVDKALSDIPIFGSGKADIAATIEASLDPASASSLMAEMTGTMDAPLPDAFYQAKTVAAKLRALRTFVREEFPGKADGNGSGPQQHFAGDLGAIKDGLDEMSLASNGVVGPCHEIHDALLSMLVEVPGLPREAQCVADHEMVLRAKERYLFDASTNRDIVSDDPWTRFVWDWIDDAHHAAENDGMIMSNIDLSYLGIYSIWMNDLGRTPMTRLSGTTTVPDMVYWERAIGGHCKKHYLPKFDGVHTRRPHHRQLCLSICGWGDVQKHPGSQAMNSGDPASAHTMAAARCLFRGDTREAVEILKNASTAHPSLLFVSLALQLVGNNINHNGRRGSAAAAAAAGGGGGVRGKEQQLEFDETAASRTDPYLQAMSSLIATGDWTSVANQRSLPLSDRALVAVRNFPDDQLTSWLAQQVSRAAEEGDVEGIVLTGIGDALVDVLARYVQKFGDIQTATLVMSLAHPRYMDDVRCRAWRNAYRSLLQRHKLFFHRTKYEVESTKRSKRRGGQPALKPPSRQIALRCVYCDAETSLANHNHNQGQGQGHGRGHVHGRGHGHGQLSSAATPATAAAVVGGVPKPPVVESRRNPLLAASINAGVSCPNCGRHLPRCVVCLEIVGVPRSDRPEEKGDETRTAGRFPTFCLRCDHVLHLDHARQWFARHAECPVPECRCRCNFRANPELDYH
ncbi:hypothetical protein GMORB2_5926 [Geosmithia morbida]|uniref:Uncharacterized protein n=1 Tax=Geosmithia morbida TaxID=1094350 RepID=A0A9P4YY62_9HYPO|nr:uncharacterized protein GMORB2_5926 [Geosmithia morbida]KAF4124210.1 hypothetical protein GMORB2_5926 [Geosmithia morbida]